MRGFLRFSVSLRKEDACLGEELCLVKIGSAFEINYIQRDHVTCDIACADLVEVGVIQHIRCLRAKLNIHSFINAGVLEQGSIPTPGARTEYRTPAGVAGSNAVRGWVGK